MSRYVVGIDLGTTNSALAYAEVPADGDAPPPIRALPIPQVVGRQRRRRSAGPAVVPLPPRGQGVRRRGDRPALVERRPTGSSGTFARDHGAKVPGRLVGSAKSWLSHAGVDRKSPILPWAAADDVAKVSPVEASTAYLAHLRDAWNHTVAGKKAADRLETPGRPADRPRLVRRRGPRADRRGRPGRGARERDPPGGAAGRLLRLARRAGGPAGGSGSRSATSCWSATSAAGRPTSP